MVCLFHIGSVAGIWFPPSTPQGRRRKPWPMAGDCAICGWRWERLGCFAGCGQRVFRAVRGATKGSAFGNRDLGCSPSVGKSGRREIFRQDKMRVRSHTVCMARNRSAVLAEKIRRAPQTHGRWTALTRKKSSKTFIFGICKLSPLSYWGISLESTSVKYSGSSQRTVTGSSVRGCRNVNSRAWRHWLSMPNSGFLWP